jgi:alcohol dehydrogenase class IV
MMFRRYNRLKICKDGGNFHMKETFFEYFMPVQVLFGNNRIEEAGALTARCGARALLVTGKRAMKENGVTDRITEVLRKSSVEVFIYDEVPPNPTDGIADEGAGVAKANGCDVIIGLGGGSALDAAKGIAVVASAGGKLWDFIGEDKVEGDILPVIAIPSTAGTGSETTPYAVFTKRDIKRKDAVVTPAIFPKTAILDPSIMKSMPAQITADTGFDALSHAIEAFMSPAATSFVQALSLESVRLVWNSMQDALADGNNLRARGDLAVASCLAGMAIAQSGVVAGHGFGMSIGGIKNTSHGRTVGLLLPHIMRYNLPAIPGKIASIAPAVNLDQTSNTEKDASNVIDRISGLMRAIDFPTTLGEIGVVDSDIEAILNDSMTQEDLDFNPRAFDRESARVFLASLL